MYYISYFITFIKFVAEGIPVCRAARVIRHLQRLLSEVQERPHVDRQYGLIDNHNF